MEGCKCDNTALRAENEQLRKANERLRQGIIRYCPVPAQVHVLQHMVYEAVVEHVKSCGVDPYTDRGLEVLGDPADWVKDLDRRVIHALEDAGFKMYAETSEWEEEYAFRDSLGLNKDGTPKVSAVPPTEEDA